jgi:hypothetical protein
MSSSSEFEFEFFFLFKFDVILDQKVVVYKGDKFDKRDSNDSYNF